MATHENIAARRDHFTGSDTDLLDVISEPDQEIQQAFFARNIQLITQLLRERLFHNHPFVRRRTMNTIEQLSNESLSLLQSVSFEGIPHFSDVQETLFTLRKQLLSVTQLAA